MHYNEFIKALQKYSNTVVQTSSIPLSCTPKNIPAIFTKTFPNLVSIINNNAEKIRIHPQQMIIIFSLQPVSVTIESNLPQNMQRIISSKNPNEHLCCTLGYILIDDKKENLTNELLNRQQNIFIDFTTGVVANVNYYVNLFSMLKQPKEIIYGKIDQELLSDIWLSLTKTKIAKTGAHYND